MRPTTYLRAAGALAALALALPASASATPSITSSVVKIGDPNVTFLTDPTGAGLISTQVRSVVELDGYALEFAEDNGVTGGGVLDYAGLPGSYRAPMTAAQVLEYPGVQSDVQAHATCSGVPALSASTAILEWQSRAGREPDFGYVPWQTKAAGLGDDPAAWLAVIRSTTRVDLAAETDLRAACARLGGTYDRADTSSPVAERFAADAAAGAIVPLLAQIANLQRTEAALRREVATQKSARDRSDAATTTARAAQAAARDAQRAAEVAYQSLFTRPIELTLAAKRFAPLSGVALVTGSATDPVTLTVEISRRQRRSLRLSTTVLVEANGVIGEQGALLLTLKPDRAVARRLEEVLANRRRGGGIPVTVLAVSGGNRDSARATLTR